MKYIDADRLIAEINKRKKSLRAGICGEAFTRKQKNEMLVASEELDRFSRIIDSLQQEMPEVDLEKEVEKYLLDNADFVTKSTSNEMVNTLARHFAELGRKQVLQEIYEGKVKPVDKITAAWLDDE